MAKPTERAIKRKPQAVILLETLTESVPEVPEDGRDFEWFTSTDAAGEFFDQFTRFIESDTSEHGDVAYLAAEVTDTSSMTLGRVKVAPENDETAKWAESIKADVTSVFIQPATKEKPKAKVRPKARNAAAAEAKKTKTPPAKPAADKQARLKKRLAEKKEMGLVVRKAAVDS